MCVCVIVASTESTTRSNVNSNRNTCLPAPVMPRLAGVAGLTFDTCVAGSEVGLEVARTWLDLVQGGVRDTDGAAPASGTPAVQVGQDILPAADVAITLEEAASQLHTSILSRLQEDHLILGTGSVEGLPLTILQQHWK